MHIAVNAAADTPIYRQIMRQIEAAVVDGRLEPGSKLKSHRELSEELVVAPLTVKKAYDELEALGYIETLRGRGTFVCASPPGRSRADQRKRLEEAARALLRQAESVGAGLDEVVGILRDLHQEKAPRQEERKDVPQ